MASISSATISHIQLEDKSANPTQTPTAGYGFIFIKDGEAYLKLDDNSYVGPFVVGSAGASDLDDLTDVVITTPAKGDILVRTTTGFVNLPVGSNGKVLTTNSATTTGLEWVTPVADADALTLALIGL